MGWDSVSLFQVPPMIASSTEVADQERGCDKKVLSEDIAPGQGSLSEKQFSLNQTRIGSVWK